MIEFDQQPYISTDYGMPKTKLFFKKVLKTGEVLILGCIVQSFLLDDIERFERIKKALFRKFHLLVEENEKKQRVI